MTHLSLDSSGPNFTNWYRNYQVPNSSGPQSPVPFYGMGISNSIETAKAASSQALLLGACNIRNYGMVYTQHNFFTIIIAIYCYYISMRVLTSVYGTPVHMVGIRLCRDVPGKVAGVCRFGKYSRILQDYTAIKGQEIFIFPPHSLLWTLKVLYKHQHKNI